MHACNAVCVVYAHTCLAAPHTLACGGQSAASTCPALPPGRFWAGVSLLFLELAGLRGIWHLCSPRGLGLQACVATPAVYVGSGDLNWERGVQTPQALVHMQEAPLTAEPSLQPTGTTFFWHECWQVLNKVLYFKLFPLDVWLGRTRSSFVLQALSAICTCWPPCGTGELSSVSLPHLTCVSDFPHGILSKSMLK